MVGDSIEYDVLAAASFGLHSVWFNEGGHQRSPSVPVPTVTNLEQFAVMVKNAA
jgi:FMN phosphatase YigB (HAD superfamily)